MQKISLEVKSQEIRQLHILYITNIISLLLEFKLTRKAIVRNV
jgi:hypothetical protein